MCACSPCSVVETLNFCNTQLGIGSAVIIGSMLRGHSDVFKYAHMKGNNVLTDLDCRHNLNITGEAAEVLAKAVLGRKKIVTFSLIPIGLLRKNRIEELVLFDKGLGAAEGHVLGTLLDSSGGSLTALSLGQNAIGADGASAIANALYRNDSLRTLKLEGNGVGEQGGRALSDALRINETLACLDLSRNGIGDEGASELAECLKESRTLHTLKIGGSCRDGARNFGDQGAVALASAIAETHSLTSLNISNNEFGERGGRAISDAIKELHLSAPLSALDARQTRPNDGTRAQASYLKKAVRGRADFDLKVGESF